jgi:hypothetical protein
MAMLESCHLQREDMVSILQECTERLWHFLDAIEDDGSWKEGPGYWNYGISTAFPFMDALKRLTHGRVNLFDHPKLKITVEFPINCYLPPDRVVNFGDCGKHFPGGMVYRRLAQEYKHHTASYFDLLTTGRKPSLQLSELLREVSDVRPRLPDPPHPSKYFPDSGWCIMRSSWADQNAHVLALKIGTTVDPHGHADVGNYIIHTHGKTVIRELGIGRYGDPGEWVFKDTHGHNLPLFDGKGQPRDQRLLGIVEQTEFTETYDYLRARIAPAYHLEKLKSFVRHYMYWRPDLFVVVDEIDVAEPMQMESRIHFAGECTLDGRTASISNDTALVNVRLLSPESAMLAQDLHTDLKPGHSDMESLEVHYLKLGLTLEAGQVTLAVAFVCGRSAEGIELRREDAELAVSWGGRSLAVNVPFSVSG